MAEGELQSVLKALRHAGIQIVAIHQHMTGRSLGSCFSTTGAWAAPRISPTGCAPRSIRHTRNDPPTVASRRDREPRCRVNAWAYGARGSTGAEARGGHSFAGARGPLRL